MNIVVFGLAVSSSWGNGHATLWRGLIRALGEEGHRVVFFERDAPYYAAHRDLFELPGHELRIYAAFEEASALVDRRLADADAAIVTSYCPDAIEATRRILDSRVRARVFYDLDTPVTLEALNAGRTVPYLPRHGLRDFDLVLSFTGGRALDVLRDRLGARRVAPLYGSVDPKVHAPASWSADFDADLSYLGTFARDRQAALDALFLEPARRLPGRKFRIGGSMYPVDFPWTPNVFYSAHVSPPSHPRFYASSRWQLNVTRKAMATFGFCPSGRLFEAAAVGAPILTDAWEGLDTFFTAGEEVVVVRSADDVIAALAMDDERRLALARRARARVLAEHTAGRRAKQLVRAIVEATS